MTIAGTIPRTSWQDPAKPITGPARKDKMRKGVIHWEGDALGAPDDIGALLRSMQASYLRTRGYSLGYGYAVVSQADHPRNGSVWEIRGDDINMASNNGDKVPGNANDWTGSVILIGRPSEHVTSQASAATRLLLGRWHEAAGTPMVRPVPHSELDYTACCGDLYRADIAAGLFDPHIPAPPPVSVGRVFGPTSLEDDMPAPRLVQLAGLPAVYVQYPGWKSWVPDAATMNAVKFLNPGVEVEVCPANAPHFFSAGGPIIGPIPPGVDGWGRPR